MLKIKETNVTVKVNRKKIAKGTAEISGYPAGQQGT